MSNVSVEIEPLVEPLSLAEVKRQLRLGPWEDSDHTTSSLQAERLRGLIQAAREYCEEFTRRSFVNKGFVQTMDAFPYFTDTALSQQAYPPAYYSLPRFATTQWNYSQMIKLFYSPLVTVSKITYIGTDGAAHDLLPGTPGLQNGQFVMDVRSEPPRIFPNSGQTWPPALYVPSAVSIHYVAGYGEDATKVPARLKIAMRQLISIWDRDPGADVPKSVKALLWTLRILDVAPTRG
jgi:hypothetical protein